MSTALPCQHFPDCSGCTAIGVPYFEQLDMKLTRLRSAFRDATLPGFSADQIRTIAASPTTSFYRNRVKLVPRRVDGVLQLGLYRAGSHEVVDMPGCPVQLPLINRAVEIIRREIDAAGLHLYDEHRHAGDLRFISVRASARRGELLIGAVTRDASCEGLASWAERVAFACPEAIGIVQNVNGDKGNVIFGDRNVVLSGRPYVVEEVAGISIHLGLTSFFQVNTDVAEMAYQSILRNLQLDHHSTILDLYAGVGAIGLVAAGSVHRVVSIESVEESVELAEASARANGIANCTFHLGRVEDRLPGVLREMSRSGLGRNQLIVVVNPPRKGLDERLIRLLGHVGPAAVAYLSCEPTTLVRDLERFASQDYDVRYVECFDMFPQTDKVETLALLSRRRKGVPVSKIRRRRESG